MTKQLNTFTNPLNGKQGLLKYDALNDVDNIDPGSLLLDVEQCKQAISTLEKYNRMQIFTRLEDMGLDSATATLDDVINNLPSECMLILEAWTDSFPLMNINPVVAGNAQSGLLTITGGWNSGDRISFQFHSINGIWHRRFNRGNNDVYRDSGWVKVETHGLQMEITATMVANLSNSLSNLTTPGEYAINGTNMALFHDNPYTTAGVYTRLSFITVKRLFSNGGVVQEIYGALGYPVRLSRFIGTDGAVSSWNVYALSGMAFTSSSTIQGTTLTATSGFAAEGTSTFQHTNPRMTATYNLGGASLTWNNIYSQNAVTVVSDSRLKPIQESLSESEIECAKKIATLYRKYKLASAIKDKGENNARYHFGIIAQDVIQAFTDSGLDWKQYGIVTYESWDAVEAVEYQPATFDEEGKQLSAEVEAAEARQAGDIYMVRYEELNCFVNAGFAASQLEIESRLSRLESTVLK